MTVRRAVPLYDGTEGDAAAEVAALAGLPLDDVQRQVLRDGMGTSGGRWTATEIAMAGGPPGQDTVLLARALAGVFLLGERVLYTSTGRSATGAVFSQAAAVCERDMFRRRVRRVVRLRGSERIEADQGARLRFLSRPGAGGRGQSADCLLFAGAHAAAEGEWTALLPCVAGRPDPQIWYGGDRVDGVLSFVVGRLRTPSASAGLAVFDWT